MNQDREYKTVKPKMIYEANTYYLSGKPIIINIIKTLDQRGTLVTEERFAENGDKILKLQYLNDTINVKIISLIFERWTRGYEKMFFNYTYDSNKCLKSITEKDSTGKVVDRYEYECNDKGHPFQVYQFDKNGERVLKESASYFYSQNFAETLQYINGTSISKDTIKINGKLACKFSATTETYNSSCDIVSFKRYDANGNEFLFEREYIYDSYGNRVEERSFTISTDPDGKQLKEPDEILKKKYLY